MEIDETVVWVQVQSLLGAFRRKEQAKRLERTMAPGGQLDEMNAMGLQEKPLRNPRLGMLRTAEDVGRT